MKKDLDDVAGVCRGDKPTNAIRETMSTLSKGNIPSKWKIYTIHPSLTVSQWISDFGERCRRISDFASNDPVRYTEVEINLGFLLYPGAFITATRQSVARKLKYPLERLQMSLDLADDSRSGSAESADGASYLIGGLNLESCQLNNGRLELLHGKLRSSIGTHRLWWKKCEAHTEPKHAMQLPLYLNPSRNELLAKLMLPVDNSVSQHEWYQVGAALTAWRMP